MLVINCKPSDYKLDFLAAISFKLVELASIDKNVKFNTWDCINYCLLL